MEVEKALKRLLVKNPFYGLFCLSLPKVITDEVPTLCIMRQGLNCKLCINPNFWDMHTDDEQIALLTHELSHICLKHMFICESFSNSQIFNLAADAEVNSYILDLPNDACTFDNLNSMFGLHLTAGMGTKTYYEEITKALEQQQQQAQQPQKPCNGGKGGNGEPNPSSPPSEAANDNDEQEEPQQSEKSEEEEPQNEEPKNEEPQNSEPKEEETESEQPKSPPEQYPEELEGILSEMDDHSTWRSFSGLPEANKQLIESTINTILKNTAEQVEKMHGTIPGELSEVISKLREKKPEVFNWKAYFRRMLGSIYDVNIKSTRRRESKRFEGSMGIQHRKKVSILVAVDTSGSVSTKELQEFFSEIDYVYKAGARVTIVECDTKINGITEYDGKNIPTIHGRGGTSFDPPVDYYMEHKKEYETLIYFTDGYADMPVKKPSGMVWVISSNGRQQYEYPGKTILIPKED